MQSNTSTEKELLKKYLEEANQLISKKFKKDKSYAFTQKWIARLIKHGGQHDQFTDQELQEAKKMSATQAQELILSGQMSYADLVRKLQEVKRREGNKFNHLTWSFFDEPLRRAQEIDEDLKAIGPEKAKEKYPLLGYVMSVKDSFYLKGAPCTVGLFANLNRVPTEDPEQMAAMKKAGAVMTSKGNVPMILFSMESTNNIYGESKNPFDSTRTAGGSSGGDGGLLATGFNNVGFGSDIAGSLRIPALFNGVCSLKPSWNRLSHSSHCSFFGREYGSERFPATIKTALDPQNIVKPISGPMARSAFDLAPVMKVLLQNQKRDLHVPTLPWRDNFEFKKRIGIIREIKFSKLSPAATRALQETEQALIKAGYEIVELDVEKIMEDLVYWSIVSFSSNTLINGVVSGKVDIKESLTELFKVLKLVNKLPEFLIKLAKWKEGPSRKGFAMGCFLKAKKVSELHVKQVQSKLFGQFLDILDEAGVDAILSPGLPIPAIKLYSSNKCMLMCCYVYVWNFLNLVSGVMNVTTVQEGEDRFETDKNDEMAQSMKENMKDSIGLPMGVSISARPFFEEIVVQIMEDVETQMKS